MCARYTPSNLRPVFFIQGKETLLPSHQLSNSTYAGQFVKEKWTNLTIGNFFKSLHQYAAQYIHNGKVKVMLPPMQIPINTWEETQGIYIVQYKNMYLAQLELAACTKFVGDGISSITTSILQIRQASGFYPNSSYTLQDFVKNIL
tara:strand:+ start:70 stop:507 length:438 start_codon:yes stop_codon:yes gene_type:complete